MAAVIDDKDLAYEVERHRPAQISWGAVLAGLTLVVAGSWLLFLLGSAIGVGVVDATDGGAVGSGLATGSAVWLFLTTVIVYFAGAFLTARLNGKSDRSIGLLHGATVWSAGTALMVVLGYMGAANLVQTGQAAINQAAAAGSVLGGMVSGPANGAGSANGGVSPESSPGQTNPELSLMDDIAAQLKRQASQVIAARVEGVDAGEVRQAAGQLDADMLYSIALQLAQGDSDGARSVITQQTSLSDQEIQNLIDNATAAVEQALPQDAQRQLQGFAEQLQQRLSERVAEATAGGSGAQEVDQQAVEQAMQQIDPALIRQVAGEIMRGDADGARRALAEQTTLSAAQVEEIIAGLGEEFQQQINQLQNRFAQIANQVQGQMQGAIGSAVAQMDASGGPQVRQREIERALAQLDGQALRDIAMALMRGELDGAKNQLAIHTTLSQAEIDDLIDGIGNTMQQQIDDVQQQINQATEAAADYAQTALWLTFAASAIGLAVSLLGGLLGARQAAQLSEPA